MAEQIDLRKKAQAAPSQAELLAKVTGKPLPKAAVPHQHKLPPGVTGTPPLPFAKPIGLPALASVNEAVIDPKSLTPEELAGLEAIGWTPDIPIPANAAELVARIVQGKLVDEVALPLPIDPRTPPLKVETVNLENLNVADQARLRKQFTEAAEILKAQAVPPPVPPPPSTVPGLAAAQATAQALEIEDDRGPVTAPPSPATPESSAPPPSETGVDAGPRLCPHCGFDQEQQDIPEPSHGDKLAFLHAILGHRTFVKTYPIFGDHAVIAFRTLSVGEIDQIYRQTDLEFQDQRLKSQFDVINQVNRYRVCLQLLRFEGTIGDLKLNHALPEGLAQETSPNAESVWNTPQNAATVAAGETLLPLIMRYVIEDVFVTESMFRVATAQCNQFNRLTAKLEAMADNSDFWRATEPPS